MSSGIDLVDLTGAYHYIPGLYSVDGDDEVHLVVLQTYIALSKAFF